MTDYLYSRELLNISNRAKHSFPDFTFTTCIPESCWTNFLTLHLSGVTRLMPETRWGTTENLEKSRKYPVISVERWQGWHFTRFKISYGEAAVGGGALFSSIETSNGPGSYSSSSDPNCEHGDAKGGQKLVTLKEGPCGWGTRKKKAWWKTAVIETDCGCFPFGPRLLPMSILIWFEMVADSFGQDIQWEMLRFPPWREFIHNLKRGPHFQTISLSLSGPTVAIPQPSGQGLSGEEKEPGWSLGGA